MRPTAVAKIGPGTLVLVVGPSGAGKDTLISMAAHACRNDPAFVFPRRIVTRPSSDTEDHDSLTLAGFDDALARGHFAFWWDAHGHRYGIPKSIEHDIKGGRTAICNVSRAVVAQLNERYERIVTVLVTAAEAILKARLEARGRESTASIDGRLSRNAAFGAFKANATIVNNDSAQEAAAALVRIIRKSVQVSTRDEAITSERRIHCGKSLDS